MTVQDFTGIELVDATLRELAGAAVQGASPMCEVSVGPPDVLDAPGLRLNWFLYRMAPHPGYRNMEAPRGPVTTGRGNPPVALQLHYLLSVHPAEPTVDGNQTEVASRMLGLVVQSLHHRHAIVDRNDSVVGAFLTAAVPGGATLIEPLRITMEALDLDTITKVWTATARPMRLSVGYQVSLAFVVDDERHSPGPPVLEPPHLTVVPSPGPRFNDIAPERVWSGSSLDATLLGVAGDLTFALVGGPGDAASSWPLAIAARHGGTFSLDLTSVPPQLVPGVRPIEVSAVVDGRQFGRDQAAVTIVPHVAKGAYASAGGIRTLTLTTAHVGPSAEAIVDGTVLGTGLVDVASPTAVTLTVPSAPGPPPASYAVMLRCGGVAGPITVVSTS